MTVTQPIVAERDGLWPALPFAAWRDTGDTLIRWVQIVGKTRLALAPRANHWWQVPLYVSTRGLTTSPIPYRSKQFEVEFDFLNHELVVRTSDGMTRTLPLIPRTVADFYHEYFDLLKGLGINVTIWPVPVELADALPFPSDEIHRTYDAIAVSRLWRALLQANRVLHTFRGRFLGKASPVHFFWGAFDLATSRFSGQPAPPHPGGVPNVGDWVMREAYSHEVCSAGFWPGNDACPQAAFYSYIYPEPPGYPEWAVKPAGAYYDTTLREFILPYDAVRAADNPDARLLEFLQNTYDAAANLAKWDRQTLDYEGMLTA
jgi:hypothetical protein